MIMKRAILTLKSSPLSKSNLLLVEVPEEAGGVQMWNRDYYHPEKHPFRYDLRYHIRGRKVLHRINDLPQFCDRLPVAKLSDLTEEIASLLVRGLWLATDKFGGRIYLYLDYATKTTPPNFTSAIDSFNSGIKMTGVEFDPERTYIFILK